MRSLCVLPRVCTRRTDLDCLNSRDPSPPVSKLDNLENQTNKQKNVAGFLPPPRYVTHLLWFRLEAQFPHDLAPDSKGIAKCIVKGGKWYSTYPTALDPGEEIDELMA